MSGVKSTLLVCVYFYLEKFNSEKFRISAFGHDHTFFGHDIVAPPHVFNLYAHDACVTLELHGEWKLSKFW